MSKIKDQVFGDAGYSSDMKLSPEELEIFRKQINMQWLKTIRDSYPQLSEKAENHGIRNYHEIADLMEHSKLWTKKARVLPQSSVDIIKSLPFIQTLKEEFGNFAISDIYDTEQRHGQEEIYWRLVRPHKPTDVGSLHRDSWFHGTFNGGYGMFADNVVTVKVWIPIYCEPGKSGLAIVAGSHLRDWKYHLEQTPYGAKPVLDEDPSAVNAKLIPTEPGNMLIFNENVLHGGVVNQGAFTRVSAEITMVLDKKRAI